MRRKKRPLVREQEGFSEHVDLQENPDFDFNTLTIGSNEHLNYKDDGDNKRCRVINSMDWSGDPWKVEKEKRPLVREQEGFSEHVDPKDNPGLDFDRLTIGSNEHLNYVDDGGNKRDRRINCMDWNGNPWKVGREKRPLVREQEGFSEHVDPKENPGLDFDRLTTGSVEHLHYVDDGKNKRDSRINCMDWNGNPWKVGMTKKSLVREQEGFSEHVDPKENPDLDFNTLTIGSNEHLNYKDDEDNKRCKMICNMDWNGNPWKVGMTKKPLVREQEGFSEHVDPKDNPGLDFNTLTIGSGEHLHYVDDGKNKRCKKTCNMDWKGNPWAIKKKNPLVREQEGFSEHVDPKDNPGLDFDRLTIGSNEHLSYIDDGKKKRCRSIHNMDWNGNPWKTEKKSSLVREQEGFSEHVDPKENPSLDFNTLTIGSNEHLNYVDDGGNKRNRWIYHMDWNGNPWKTEKQRPLVREQEGFSEHVDPKENPSLDFNTLTIGSGEHLHYIDDGKKKRCRSIHNMDWNGNPWKAKAIRPLVREQEGFSEHVDPMKNPGLDFNTLTIGSGEHLHYVDDGKKNRYRIISNMKWKSNPWAAKKRPLVREREGFSEHVDPKENPGLDFDRLTIGSNEHLNYVDDGGNKRDRRINYMDWNGNPWKVGREKRPLVREQEGFSEHVDPKDNPGLDFDRLTTSSGENLHYIDNGKCKRCKRISDMDWGNDPWKTKTKRPLVREQEGFSEHVDPKDNPGLDFDSLAISSCEHLHYIDNRKYKRCKRISDMDWGNDPWKTKTKRPLVREQEGFSEHVDPKDNPGLDFDKLTTGSEQHLIYVDDERNKRDRRINCMDWNGNPWKVGMTKKSLVREQEGFSEHVDPKDNPGLDFDKLTTGSEQHLIYVDDGKNKRCRIIHNMDWNGNPWKAKAIRPLVREQEGFSEHVDPKDNPDLDFNTLTIGSNEHMYYVDDEKNKRCRVINNMDWDRSPWKAEKNSPLVREQEGFSEHVDPKDNPDLDFNTLTIGSGEHLRYVDDGKKKRCRIIQNMDWNGNPWKAKAIGPLVREQEGFSDHVDSKDNLGLDFNTLTIGSGEHLHYVDDGKNKRCKIICRMNWDSNPWQGKNKDELVGEDPRFWSHCDENDPRKISSIKKLIKMSTHPVKMHCDKGHQYPTTIKSFYSDVKEDCPYCSGRLTIPGETDAVTADPEIKAFFLPGENSIDINKVSPRSTIRIKWKCPFCGYRFKLRILTMVNRHPKCSRCRDTGIVDSVDLRNREIPHLIIVRGGEDA